MLERATFGIILIKLEYVCDQLFQGLKPNLRNPVNSKTADTMFELLELYSLG